jgi:hypothetical protein
MNRALTLPALNAMISSAARQIAGCTWDDTEGATLADRLTAVYQSADKGSDCDLTHVDRDAIATLQGLLSGESFSLHDYTTGDMIRPATPREVCACAVAQSSDGGSGVIIVDGISCYAA